MDLQFVNRRLIEPAGSLPAWTAYEAAARNTMGLAPGPATTGDAGQARVVAPADLSELDRRQLVAAVSAVYGADGVTVEAFFAGETDEETDEVRQMPIEWWDVVDGSGSPVYQLWLCHMDCGTLFGAGTTDESGYVAQFHLHDFAGDAAALQAARAAAVAHHPDSMLASLNI
jgi:hypothetical protein